MLPLRIALIGLFPLAFLASCDDEVEPVFVDIPGKLKKELYFASEDAVHPERFTEYKYGENGKVLEECYHEYPDYQYYFIRKEYDNRDRLIRETSYTNEFGKFEKGSYSVFEYDEQDKLIRRSSYYQDQQKNEETYEYDDLGRKVRSNFSHPNEEYIFAYEIFTYSENGLPYKDYHYSYDALEKKHTLDLVYEYEYDEDGKLVKRWMIDGISNNPSGFELGLEKEFFYDQEGVLIESKRYDPYWGYVLRVVTRYEYY